MLVWTSLMISALAAAYSALHCCRMSTLVWYAFSGGCLGFLAILGVCRSSAFLKLRSSPCLMRILVGLLTATVFWSCVRAYKVWSPPQRFSQVVGALPPCDVVFAQGCSLPLEIERWGFLLNCSDDQIREFSTLHFEGIRTFKKLEDLPSFHMRYGRFFGFKSIDSVDPALAIAGTKGNFLFSFIRPREADPVQLIIFQQYGFKVGD